MTAGPVPATVPSVLQISRVLIPGRCGEQEEDAVPGVDEAAVPGEAAPSVRAWVPAGGAVADPGLEDQVLACWMTLKKYSLPPAAVRE